MTVDRAAQAAEVHSWRDRPWGAPVLSQMESLEDDVTSKQEPWEMLLPVRRLFCQIGFPLKQPHAWGRPCGPAGRGCLGWVLTDLRLLPGL